MCNAKRQTWITFMAALNLKSSLRMLALFRNKQGRKEFGSVWECTKGSVNLIHDIEGRGLVVVQGEDKGEGAEGLLPARQVGNVLPALLGRPHTEHNALQQHQHNSVTCY